MEKATDRTDSTFRACVLKTLSDRFMMDLALLLIPTTLLPLLFSFSRVSLIIFHVVNLVIVVVFALEYFLKLAITKPHWKYVRDPWHVLDLVIILLAALDLIPLLPLKGWRASPLLRLLRLARVFALGGRAVVRSRPPAEDAMGGAAPHPKIHFSILTDAGLIPDASLEEAKRAVDDPIENWIGIHGLSGADIADLSRLLSIPAQVLESKLSPDNFPGIDDFAGYTIITLWDAVLGDQSKDKLIPLVDISPVVIIRSRSYIATLSRRPPAFAGRLVGQRQSLAGESLITQVLYSILKSKLDDYRSILLRLEKAVAGFEDTVVETRPRGFLDTTFHLKKVIQKQGYNINHYVQVLDQLMKIRREAQGAEKEPRDSFVLLHSEAVSLNDLYHTIRDNTMSLIELQLNKVSFDLNRVMKILAVITCLALVPTIIGGLLGQNLKDQPYNITIYEIFFFVISIMLLGLYIFYRKGWLK